MFAAATVAAEGTNEYGIRTSIDQYSGPTFSRESRSNRPITPLNPPIATLSWQSYRPSAGISLKPPDCAPIRPIATLSWESCRPSAGISLKPPDYAPNRLDRHGNQNKNTIVASRQQKQFPYHRPERSPWLDCYTTRELEADKMNAAIQNQQAVTVRKGDTLEGLMRKQGFQNAEL